MADDRPVIDLSGYQSFDLPPTPTYQKVIPVVIIAAFTLAFWLGCWARMNSEPHYYAICVVLVLGCAWLMHVFDSHHRPVVPNVEPRWYNSALTWIHHSAGLFARR